MPWTAENIPKSLKSAGLTLTQANEWGSLYDRFKAGGADQGDAASRAWIAIKKRYKNQGGRWVSKQSRQTESMGLTFLAEGEVQNPARLSGDPQANRLTFRNRAYHLQKHLGEQAVLWGIYEGHVLFEDSETETLHVQSYEGTGQALKLKGDPMPVTDEVGNLLVHELAEHEHGRFDLVEIGRRNSARDEKRLADLVSVGLDLLGDNKESELINSRRMARRKAARMAAANPIKNTVSNTGPTRSAATRSTSVEETRGVTPDNLSGAAPHLSITPPSLSSADVADAVHARLLGESEEDTHIIVIDIDHLTEDQGRVVQDALFQLANELDHIATTRIVSNTMETLQTLKTAQEALSQAKITRKLPLTARPGSPAPSIESQRISPEEFWSAYRLGDLQNRLESSLHGWIMVSEIEANALAYHADGLRGWVRYQMGLDQPVFEDHGADFQDLLAGDLDEAAVVAKKMMAKAKGKKCCCGQNEALPPFIKGKKKKADPNEEPDAEEDMPKKKAKKPRKGSMKERLRAIKDEMLKPKKKGMVST